MAKKGLGKGLGAIINSYNDINTDAKLEIIKEIPINKIKPNPEQPRKQFNETSIKELAQSIKEKGLIQPIVVVKKDNNYYIVAGERRLRAYKFLGYKKIKSIIVDYKEKELLEIAIIENVQREDLTPIEEAMAYEELINKYGYTQAQVAKIVGKNRSTITNTIRLLKLPDEVKKYINEGKISAGHARAILSLDNPKKQIETARNILKGDLSVRDVEDTVYGKKNNNKIKKELKNIEEQLQNYFMTKVSLQGNYNKGKIILHYYSREELERLINKLEEF